MNTSSEYFKVLERHHVAYYRILTEHKLTGGEEALVGLVEAQCLERFKGDGYSVYVIARPHSGITQATIQIANYLVKTGRIKQDFFSAFNTIRETIKKD